MSSRTRDFRSGTCFLTNARAFLMATTREDMDLTIGHTKDDLIADFKPQGPAIAGRDHNASAFGNRAMNVFHVCHLDTRMSS